MDPHHELAMLKGRIAQYANELSQRDKLPSPSELRGELLSCLDVPTEVNVPLPGDPLAINWRDPFLVPGNTVKAIPAEVVDCRMVGAHASDGPLGKGRCLMVSLRRVQTQAISQNGANQHRLVQHVVFRPQDSWRIRELLKNE